MNVSRRAEHTLEFLLAFDGRRHWYEDGYFAKFEIKRVQPTEERPHGLRYALTLHDAAGRPLIGFDNAHAVSSGSRFKRRPVETDHWHRTEDDSGRSYEFKSAEKLIEDFFDEIARVLTERRIPLSVVRDGETGG